MARPGFAVPSPIRRIPVLVGHRIPGMKRKTVISKAAIHPNQPLAQENGVTCGTGNSAKNHKNKSTTSRISMIIA